MTQDAAYQTQPDGAKRSDVASRHPHPWIAACQDGAARAFGSLADPMVWLGRARWRARWRGTRHDRLPRTERREAVAALACSMLAHVEIRSLRIVDYRSARGEGISRERYARETGMSLDRVKGALSDLASCAHVGGYQRRRRRLDGQIRGRIATRWLTIPMLQALGRAIGKNLVRWRKQLLGARSTSAPRREPSERAARATHDLTRALADVKSQV